MIVPNYPTNEIARQAAVEKYQLLDTLEEDAYDNITALVSYVCDAPISLITLLDKDRNYLKSHHGVPFNESPRDISFCGHAINAETEITIIEDARKDERFQDNPLVSDYKAIFYAGAPLVDSDGFKLGTLCVYDHKPRQLNEQQISAIISMAKQVIHLFEQRYQNFKLERYQEDLKRRNENLEKFSGVVSHDLKSPLSNIISLTQLLEEENKNKLTGDSLTYLDYLKTSSCTLKEYIDGLLQFYKSDELLLEDFKAVDVTAFIRKITLISDAAHLAEISVNTTLEKLYLKEAPMLHVLTNLFTNAIKYNSKSKKQIVIDLTETEVAYEFTIADNADGIPETHLDKIFDLFTIVGQKDNEGNLGTGIGLATVKKIIESLGGTITVTSVPHEGSTFRFSIAKPVK